MIASLLAFVGCQNEELVNENTNNGGEKVILTANIQGATDSRVVLTPDTENGDPIVKVAWREYDENNPETFWVVSANGESWFTQVSDTEFSGTLPQPYSDGSYMALYNLDLFNNFGNHNHFTFKQDGTLREQDMMMAAFFNEDDTSIEFQHQISILKPTFKVGEDTVNNTITHIEMGEIFCCTTTVVIDVEPTAPDTTLKNDIYLTIPILEEISSGRNQYNFMPGKTFNFAVTADGKDYTGSLTIPQMDGWNPEGKLFTATIALTEVIPYVTFRAVGEQTLVLKQTKSQKLDEWGNAVYEDDEETIPVLVPNPYPWDEDDNVYIEYSVGNSNVWTKFTPESQPVAFGGDKGDLHLRGISPNGTLKAQIVFGNNTPVACSGDIRTLVNWENHETADTSDAIFYGLFENCTVLTTAPELPATTLAERCYWSMFWGCTSLDEAPELPATTLANDCYVNMFHGCTKLTEAPELKAAMLVEYCYNGMFFNCTSLNSITMLATNITATACLDSWVSGVARSGTFTKAASLVQGTESGEIPTGVSGIPSGWTVQDYVAPGEGI